MSVLIKGMSMPNDGREWIMFLRLTSGKVELFDPIGEDESVFFEAVEIPPHGRLIDADALIGQYKGDIWTAQIDYAEGVRDVVKDIKAAPTIIPAEGKED